MHRDAATILEEALFLPVEERAAIASSLIQSLDPKIDPSAEAAWATEIAKRVREIDTGTVQLIPWSEARKKILHSA